MVRVSLDRAVFSPFQAPAIANWPLELVNEAGVRHPNQGGSLEGCAELRWPPAQQLLILLLYTEVWK